MNLRSSYGSYTSVKEVLLSWSFLCLFMSKIAQLQLVETSWKNKMTGLGST